MKKNENNSPKQVSKLKTAIGIIFLILGLFIITSSLNITLKTNKTVLTYQKDGEINYKVYVKGEDSNNTYLDQDQIYNTNLIDDIVTTFNYNFVANDKFDFTYTYQIKARLNVFDTNNQPQTEKEFIIVPEETKKLQNSNGYKINEVFAINYETYQQYIQDINPDFNGILTINLETNVEGIYENSQEEISQTDKMSMEIPIREGTIQISKSTDIDNEYDLHGDETSIISNDTMTIIGAVLLIAAIILLIYEGTKAYNLNKRQVKYHKEIDDIHKRYQKIMLRTNKLPSLTNKRVIEIANLTDLIELEKELNAGILIYEKVKKNETWFVIIHQNEAWIYKKSL